MSAAPAHAEIGNKTALINVRVFDGTRLLDPGTVVIDGGLIATDPTGARTIDCKKSVLLPGLIDAHVHLHGRDTLHQLASYGVTTALDMATWPAQLLSSLRGIPGVTEIRSPGLPAIGPNGSHAKIPNIPPGAIIRRPADVEEFITARLADGADYIKIVLDEHGPDQTTLHALVTAAHAHGKRTVVHAAAPGPFAMAVHSGTDIITHIPLGQPPPADLIARIAARRQISVPTLTMMEGIATSVGKPEAYVGASRGVGELHRAGVPILAGTDANTQPGVPFQVQHGTSLHHELELLVDAGLTPLDTLRAATSTAARCFHLWDRGTIMGGLRADLLLIDGDPLRDIRATRNIQRIWCAGIEHSPA